MRVPGPRDLLRRLARRIFGRASAQEDTSYGSNAYSRRERFLITDLIYEQFPADETFSILDGGARGGPSDPRWRAIGDKRLVIHGFEVDVNECAKLNEQAAQQGLPHHYYATALWSSSGHVTVHENKASGGGSVYRQNMALTNRWKFENTAEKFLARDMFYPTTDRQFVATTIDSWAHDSGIRSLDFVKLNVQGAELDILEGATNTLKSVLGLQLEMSFVRSYHERPLFSDVDVFVRRQGFHFFDLVGLHYIGRADSPITSLHTPGLYPLHGQLIEAHGVYFRDPIASESEDSDGPTLERVLKLASIAEIYGQVEYAFELLNWLQLRLHEKGADAQSQRIAALKEAALQLHHRYLGAPSS